MEKKNSFIYGCIALSKKLSSAYKICGHSSFQNVFYCFHQTSKKNRDDENNGLKVSLHQALRTRLVRTFLMKYMKEKKRNKKICVCVSICMYVCVYVCDIKHVCM